MNPSKPQAKTASNLTVRLFKRAVAEAAVAAAAELALGKRLFIAYEAMRRLSNARPRTETEQQRLPTPEQAVEDIVQDVIERGRQVMERHKPVIDRARARTRARLEQPSIGAAVVGGAVLGAVSAIGVLPAAIGAGTAYLLHRKLHKAPGDTVPAKRETG